MRLKIGQLAKISGVGAGAIRFYEKEGLLICPDRSSGNYRIYDNESVERLRFIRHCRQQGISIEEIKKMLEFMDKPGSDCKEIHKMIDRHVAKIDAQIAELVKLREMLLQKRANITCEKECNLVKVLSESDDCSFCQRLKAFQEQAEK